MKKTLLILLALMLGMSLLQAAAFEKEAKSRTTKVHISSEKPIGTGFNVFTFDITKDGKAPLGARVDIKAFMPAMPGMPAMDSKVTAKDLGNGKYEAKLNIAMNGTWQIHIFITPVKGKKTRVKTSINF